MKLKQNWTIGEDGRYNSSTEFEVAVSMVAGVLHNVRLGADLNDVARVIIAKLAHERRI